MSQAAAQLGVPRNTLRYRMEKHGLGSGSPAPPRPQERAAPWPRRPSPESTPAPLLGPSGGPWAVGRPLGAAARDLPAGAARAPPERNRGRPSSAGPWRAMVDKVRSFGGVVDELSPAGLIAAFGLEPLEDAVHHAAFAAIAIQTDRGQGAEENPARPAVTLALHTELAQRRSTPRGGEPSTGTPSVPPGPSWKRWGDSAAAGTVMVSAQAVNPPGPALRAGPAGGRDWTVRRRASARGRCGTSSTGSRASSAARPSSGCCASASTRRRRGAGRSCPSWGSPGSASPGSSGSSGVTSVRERRGRRGRPCPSRRTIPFHPLIDLLRRAFRIDEGDSEAVIIEKIERAGRPAGRGPPVRRSRSCAISCPSTPATRGSSSWTRSSGGRRSSRRCGGSSSAPPSAGRSSSCGRTCTGSDRATEEFIATLADSLAAHRSLMILTYRPGYAPPVSDRLFHTRLTLAALSPATASTMARGLLSADELPEALQALLVRRTEGNPFFVEEVLRSLQETEVLRREGDRLIVAARPRCARRAGHHRGRDPGPHPEGE